MCLVATFFQLTATAQSMQESLQLPIDFLRRVNTIESFIKRFNNEEDVTGNPVKQSRDTTFLTQRKWMILSLFNVSKLVNLDSAGKERILRFIHQVNDARQPTMLSFYDNEWYAEVPCSVLYKQQPQELSFIMVNEQSRPKVSHWAIQSVKGDFLKLETKKDTGNILPPNSHGTDFVGLPAKLSKPGSVGDYVRKNKKEDLTSIFLYATANHEIEFKTTQSVTYHFLQVKGWILKVREINRKNGNAGWLIEDLISATEEEKKIYASKVLNIN